MKDGGNKHLRMCDTSEVDSQKWTILPLGKTYYRFVNKEFSEKCIDIVNDGVKNNKLAMAQIGSYSGQYWKLTKYEKIK